MIVTAETVGPGRPPADPDEDPVLLFLVQVGRNVEAALRARRALLDDLVQARHDQPSSALDRAGRASRRCVRAFDDALVHLERTRVPSLASECAFELRQWLEAHVEACDHLHRAAMARDPADLERAVRCLTQGAGMAQRYNDARQRLMRHIAAMTS